MVCGNLSIYGVSAGTDGVASARENWHAEVFSRAVIGGGVECAATVVGKDFSEEEIGSGAACSRHGVGASLAPHIRTGGQ